MKNKISVVIICKNEEHIIGTTIDSVTTIADEIIVYDTGSSDNTVSLAAAKGVLTINGEWFGYGKTKQKAIAFAKNDWILNLDSDEVLDDELQNSIRQLELTNEKFAYVAKFRNFLGSVCLKWGEFGFDSHMRLFNRKQINWNDNDVHEKLLIPTDIKKIVLKGCILHYTMKDTKEYVNKSVNYALLNAEQYYKNGKRPNWIKQYIAPRVTFLKYYIFKMGFLDGWAGLFSARMSSLYTYLKYARLRELWEEKKRQI